MASRHDRSAWWSRSFEVLADVRAADGGRRAATTGLAAVAAGASLLSGLLLVVDADRAWILLLVIVALFASATLALGASAAKGAAPRPAGPAVDLYSGDQWLTLVQDTVDLVEELDRGRNQLDGPQRVLADHIIVRVAEVLQRSAVEVISGDEPFDRNRHAAVGGTSPSVRDQPIVETLSPGFAVDRRVLRRARVKVSGEPTTVGPS